MRQNLARDPPALVGDSDLDVLGGLANQDFNRRRPGTVWFALLNDGLNGVAEKFSNDVLQVALDVGESGIDVTVDVDVRNLNMPTVGSFDQFLGSLAAALDDFLCITFEEYFTDGVHMRVMRMREVPW